MGRLGSLALYLALLLGVAFTFNQLFASSSAPVAKQARQRAPDVYAGGYAVKQQPFTARAGGTVTADGTFKRRIVAIGDVHGDLKNFLTTLRFAGLVDLRGNWIGKNAIFVSTGDCVDRGRDTIAIYQLMDKLRGQAEAAGGRVVNTLGNHELMNAMGDWRYVTKEDIDTFGGERNRRRAMSKDGWIGQTWMANYSVTARVPYVPAHFYNFARSAEAEVPLRTDEPFLRDHDGGGEGDMFTHAAASFVHGGILPTYGPLSRAKPVETINAIGNALLELVMDEPAPLRLPSDASPEMREIWSTGGPFWARDYALEEDEEKVCKLADEATKKLGVRRLVMGHTPQFDGILSRCDGKVLVIDTGISRAYGGPLSALEILVTLAPQSRTRSRAPEGLSDDDVVDKSVAETWLEREIVSAMYEDGSKAQLAKSERQLELPRGLR